MVRQAYPILQSKLDDPPWTLVNGFRLPGTGPIAPDDWLRVDDAFAEQMALRDRLIAEMGERVHITRPEAETAAEEILHMALEVLRTRSGYRVAPTHVTRPDGVEVKLDDLPPLATLGRLVQEDICLLQQQGDEHALTAACLCFPASWTLAEKIDRPLIGIHEPVTSYTGDIARRVQRLFDAIRVDRPLRRANCLLYDDPTLFQPRMMAERRIKPKARAEYIRTERQCLLRLPNTNAVAFSIHTTVLARANLPADQDLALQAFLAQEDALT